MFNIYKTGTILSMGDIYINKDNNNIFTSYFKNIVKEGKYDDFVRLYGIEVKIYDFKIKNYFKNY